MLALHVPMKFFSGPDCHEQGGLEFFTTQIESAEGDLELLQVQRRHLRTHSSRVSVVSIHNSLLFPFICVSLLTPTFTGCYGCCQ